jgi:Siderophore-interacting protein
MWVLLQILSLFAGPGLKGGINKALPNSEEWAMMGSSPHCSCWKAGSMSNIAVTHADSGLVRMEVLRREQVSPHIVRVTFGGECLKRFEYKGYDQWFRLALPIRNESGLDRMPQKFGIGGYLRYLTLPKGSRPVIRNYTIRHYRTDPLEMDVDFVVHGTEGIAGPWARNVAPGATVAFIDQGCGWKPVPAQHHVMVADESGMPAVLGILRDMPRDAVGHAVIELIDVEDAQEVAAPPGVALTWVVRSAGQAPGVKALEALKSLDLSADTYAFAVGESALATGARRYLVNERGVPKKNVTFSGYWKLGKASPS